MRFTIEKQALVSALQKAAPITARKSTLPILSYVLMEAQDGKLTVTATDLESGIRLSVPCEPDVNGTICAPGRTILNAVSNLTEGPVKFSLGDNLRLKIKSGSASMSIACLDAADYPAWQESSEDTQYVTVIAGTLSVALERVMFAASSEESRFNLNGIHFEQEGELLNIVATDGHRLAFDSLPLNFGQGFKVTVPKKSVIEMKKLLDDCAGDVTVGFNSQNMILTTETLTATARLVSSDYPDYRKVIPQESENSFVLNRGTLASTVKRVAFLLSDRNRGLDFKIDGNALELSATHPDLGSASDTIEIQREKGESIEVAINGYYLQEALSAFGCENLRVERLEDGRPFVFRPEPNEGSYFNLVMPMRK